MADKLTNFHIPKLAGSCKFGAATRLGPSQNLLCYSRVPLKGPETRPFAKNRVRFVRHRVSYHPSRSSETPQTACSPALYRGRDPAIQKANKCESGNPVAHTN